MRWVPQKSLKGRKTEIKPRQAEADGRRRLDESDDVSVEINSVGKQSHDFLAELVRQLYEC